MALVIFNGRFILKLNPLGDFLAFVAALCWAVYSILLKLVANRYSAVWITRKVFFYGLVTMIPFFAVHPWQFPLSGFLHPVIAGNLIFLGFIASFLCFFLWSWVNKKIGALKASNYIYLNPITTVVVSALVLSEPMTTLAFVGSAMILIGVFFANRH